jgi:hypothetical protein
MGKNYVQKKQGKQNFPIWHLCAGFELRLRNNLGKFIDTFPSKKFRRILCVCTGIETLGVNIKFRQFPTGSWVRIPYTHEKFPQIAYMRVPVFM